MFKILTGFIALSFYLHAELPNYGSIWESVYLDNLKEAKEAIDDEITAIPDESLAIWFQINDIPYGERQFYYWFDEKMYAHLSRFYIASLMKDKRAQEQAHKHIQNILKKEYN